jgi:hypothetical protein
MTKVPHLIVCLSLILLFSSCARFFSQTGSPTPQASPSPEELTGQHGWEPVTACSHLADKLKPGLYRHEGNNIFGCLSEAKSLGSGSPPNNIVYYARGDVKRARQVGLILNVNEPATAEEARKTLHDYSEDLTMKALGAPLSPSAGNAILAGKTGQGKIDTTRIQIVRHDFANGKGYELHYIITPALE